MDYLTYDEFKEYSTREINEKEFNNLLPKASAVLNSITDHFYVRFDMDIDNGWRVKQFKQALTAQIEYFDILGASSFEEINNAPQSFSAGRTSVTNPSRYKVSDQNESKVLVAEDVYIYLSSTGLLFRGAAVW
ncbi:hypothetical protein [Oceanobacillus oncorhynchi]|uniref:hypothetical protein n=1 Tax=Oceanobacillus oncorhynchi TaxID=545501 RepID=UPI001868DC2B|nr:hypothetical protein [Oceanobacillus oncorhynchi]